MAEEHPLVVAGDDVLLDEILRVAAAAGCEVERAPDLAAARGRWARAPLVVLDEEAARTPSKLLRRNKVLLVCKGAPTPLTWERAFNTGSEKVLSLPDEEGDLIGAFADVVDGPARDDGVVIGVIGGRGGAGASVLAAAVAYRAEKSGSGGLLVDCDPLGGGIDVLLAAERDRGPRWPELDLGGRVSMTALSEALPRKRYATGALSFVSYGREGRGPDPAAIEGVLHAGRRAGRTVVCDLPRYFGAETATVLGLADLVVVVVPAELRACAAARQVLARLEPQATRIGVAVRTPSPAGLDPREIADAVGAPLIASMGRERSLSAALDRGEFVLKHRGQLASAAADVLAAAHGNPAGVPR
ncbi:helicase [Amycolatopsis orientalis]|uniref:Helicase n=1 Tax=Amycolatopsis orientalis TaxID=31958 RepID=A0A193BR33_AMYOR|nr:septum site-determining protein Ssd [Amycolatopsis orientalis]ANN14666.1 helicase [Amycolatopsis orientalis]